MKIYRRSIDLLEAEVGDDLVALDAEGGNCFGFNAVAANVWKQLETPKSFDAIKQYLLQAYDVEEGQCAAELEELMHQLVAKGLVDCQDGLEQVRN